MDIKEQAEQLINEMTLEEKVNLCAGASFWLSPGAERLGLRTHLMTDGPHGLRKQEEGADHLGINQSLPSVCFPTASASACSFDRNLLESMGKALGEKCVRENVSVILGPGVNMKRSPLCGRNFEYFSEDPCLAGELGAAFTTGVQSSGTGVSVKHFAVNTQETNRMTVDSVVDERALHEIYLEAFRRVIQEAKPWTVMCSYNQINGEYANTNHWLLTELLRKTWHYDGLVVSDWGAVTDREAGIKAGMDLEMPGVGPDSDKQLLDAVKKGSLREEEITCCAKRMTELILKMQREKPIVTGSDRTDHLLAEKIAAQSAVLLKNEGKILPLGKEQRVAFIGQMAKKPRYQGAGSSKINTFQLDNALACGIDAGMQLTYAEGYGEDSSQTDSNLLNQAVQTAAAADVAIVFAGLPDAYESEGFDRDSMKMPESHILLIERVAKANPNTVVVLQCGSPVEMPWRDCVRGILLMYLGGEAGALATIDLLTGQENPSGKLAETWPETLEDTPCGCNYPGKGKAVWHRESIFVGYRYYDAAGCRPAYPFGYGLSYTDFEYSNLKIVQQKDEEKQREEQQESITERQEGITEKQTQEYIAEVTVKNIGQTAGREIVQLYLGRKDESVLIRAPRELKNFAKVYLQPGEEKTIALSFQARDAAYYNPSCSCWCVEGGTYTVQIGASSRDIRLEQEIFLQGDGKEELLKEQKQKLGAYIKPGRPLSISDEEFLLLFKEKPAPENQTASRPFTINSSIGDIRDTKIGKALIQKSQKSSQRWGDDPSMQRMAQAMLYSTPIRSLRLMGDMNWRQVQGIAEMANGHFIKGAIMLKKKR